MGTGDPDDSIDEVLGNRARQDGSLLSGFTSLTEFRSGSREDQLRSTGVAFEAVPHSRQIALFD